MALQDVAAQLHLRLAALSSSQLPLVVFPTDAFEEFKTKLDSEAAAQGARFDSSRANTPLLLGSTEDANQRSGSPMRAKRKWRYSPDGPDSTERQPRTAAAIHLAAENAHTRLRAGLAALQQGVEAERNNEVHFRAQLLDVTGIEHRSYDAATTVQDDFDEAGDRIEDANNAEQGVRGSSSVLQQLNAQLRSEKEASNGLWSRIKSAAGSLF